MSYRTRNYVRGDDPMYRAIAVSNTGTKRYAGPYATRGPATAAANQFAGPGWGAGVEVCYPVWLPADAPEGLPSELRPELVDTIAQIIRIVDGNHTMGAGALAEAIVDRLNMATIHTAAWKAGYEAGLVDGGA